MEESLEKRVYKDSDDEDEFEILAKINKIHNKTSKAEIVKPKITQNKKDFEGRRMLANKNKLTSIKFK